MSATTAGLLASDCVLGIDGGGTKTVAWLCPMDASDGDKTLGVGQAGPGNPRGVGFETALANVEYAIAQAFAAAGIEPGAAAAAGVCLAGAGRPVEQEQVRAWVKRTQTASCAHVGGDAEPILAAGSPDFTGIALISGTGSLAWGRNEAGTEARAGGWGYLFGDEGGAYAIAVTALRAAACAADGRGPTTDLLQRLQEAIGAKAPSELIEQIYTPNLGREQVAALAVHVFDLASTDVVASQLLDTATDDLAMMVDVLVRKLSLTAGYTLAAAGSVLLNQPAFVQRIDARLRQRGATPVEWRMVPQPVAGAVALARRLLSRDDGHQSSG